MNPIDLNGLIVGLSIWENQRFSQLPDYALPFFSQGGWEGWLQVELAMFFTGYGYDVVREQNPYDNHLRALASLDGRQNGIMLVAVAEPILEETLRSHGYQTVPSTQNNIRIMYKLVK